jgi:hypothetical protein
MTAVMVRSSGLRQVVFGDQRFSASQTARCRPRGTGAEIAGAGKKNGDTKGFGLIFVDAVMCGCLVISTGIGGVEEVIQGPLTQRP